MQISKLENDKASGKLNLDALKRKNYKSAVAEKKKETPNMKESSAPDTQIGSQK